LFPFRGPPPRYLPRKQRLFSTPSFSPPPHGRYPAPSGVTRRCPRVRTHSPYTDGKLRPNTSSFFFSFFIPPVTILTFYNGETFFRSRGFLVHYRVGSATLLPPFHVLFFISPITTPPPLYLSSLSFWFGLFLEETFGEKVGSPPMAHLSWRQPVLFDVSPFYIRSLHVVVSFNRSGRVRRS